jgi:hypothetical protein
MSAFKLKHGYGSIRKYLAEHQKALKMTARTDEDADKAKYVEDLLHDLEYLELCAEAVDFLKEAEKGFKIIKKL